MPDASRETPSAAHIFQSVKFWVSLTVPGRKKLLQDIVSHGGIVVDENSADYCLVNAELNVQSARQCYSYKLIEDSLQHGDMQDVDRYHVRTFSSVDRPVGSTSLTAKTARTRFSTRDDQILRDWVIPFAQKGGRWKGNEIYKQLAAQYPHHTYQSWRGRFIEHLAERHKEEICGIASVKDGSRSPKRRRLNNTASETVLTHPGRTAESPRTPALVHDAVWPPSVDDGPKTPERRPQHGVVQSERTNDQFEIAETPPIRPTWANELDSPAYSMLSDSESVELTDVNAQRQSLVVTKSLREKLSRSTFNLHEARRLYKAVPDIHFTSPQKLTDCYRNMAETWNSHTAEEWEAFYESTILPAYMRRNGLTTGVDLDEHVYELLRQGGPTRESAPEIKQEPTLSIWSSADRQRAAELERARAEAEDIALSDISAASQPPANSLIDHCPPVNCEQPASPVLAPPSPVADRAAVHANEGRKRNSQPTSSATLSSNSQPSQMPAPSQKKKLFGRTLSQQNSQRPSQLDSSGVTHGHFDVVDASIATQSSGQAAIISSSASLPTAQKPPKSYQVPPQSATTSQESAKFETAVVHATHERDKSVQSKGPTKGGTVQTNGPPHDLVIDLLGDGTVDDLEVESQGPPSDTGSEYMAFDTAPDRSQLWDTAPVEIEERGCETAAADNRENEESDADQSRNNVTQRPRQAGTPRPQRMAPEETVISEVEENETCRAQPADKGTTARLETQALFQQKTRREVSEYALPSPEGGWEAFGLSDLNEIDPDRPISSVEPADSQSDERRTVSPAASVSETTASESLASEDVPIEPFATSRQKEVYEISSGEETDGQETEVTTDDEDRRITLQLRNAQAKHELVASSDRQFKNAQRESESDDGEGLVDRKKIKEWVESQRLSYSGLPNLVLQRLCSTAIQATCMNIPAATLLLRSLVEDFEFVERKRRLQHESQQQQPESLGFATSIFKPKIRLSDPEAKALLPSNMLGVWTPDDDKDLVSKTTVSISRVKKKHGSDGVRKRAQFLRFRYGLRDGTNGSAAATSANSTQQVSSLSSLSRMP